MLCLLLASAGSTMSAVHEVVAAEPPKSKPQQLPGMLAPTPPLLPETLHPKSMRDYQPKLTPEEHPASRGVIVRVEIIVPCHLDPNVPSEHVFHIGSLTHAGGITGSGCCIDGRESENWAHESSSTRPSSSYRSAAIARSSWPVSLRFGTGALGSLPIPQAPPVTNGVDRGCRPPG